MEDFWEKVLPGSIKSDHGKFNAADLLLIVINILLFGFTAYRSWRFLVGTFSGTDTTGEYAVFAIIGLVGLDVAAVAWSIVWMFGSTDKWQDVVALVMFVISLVGMVLTSMTDTLRGESSVPPVLQVAAYYGVPAIILLNVAAGIVYHMISPQVQLQRRERRMNADIQSTRRLGDIAQQDTAMKLKLAEDQAKQNDELIVRQQRLAEQKMTLDAIRLGIDRALSDDETVKRKGAQVQQEITSNVAPQTTFAQTAPALPTQPPAVPTMQPPTSQSKPIPQTNAPSSPAPDLQQMMFLVHLDTDGAVCAWRVRNEEKREGVHWDGAYNMYAVFVRAADGIDAGKRAEKMLQPYLNGSNGSIPKA